MASPLILVDVSTVHDGRLGELRERIAELANFVEHSSTRAISYDFFLSADERRMTVIQVHPDSDSVEAQMAAAAPIFARFRDLLSMTAMDVYGEPSDSLLVLLSRKAELLGSGRPPTIHKLQAGFDRFRG